MAGLAATVRAGTPVSDFVLRPYRRTHYCLLRMPEEVMPSVIGCLPVLQA